jgi:rod shape-determining protein MreC
MKNKVHFSFRLKFPEFLFILLLLISSFSLAFSSGSFVLNIKNIGFSILSTIEKGVSTSVKAVTNTVNSVGELRKLKKEYDQLVIKLEKFEQLQRSNADIRKENERLKEQLDFVSSIEEKNIPAQIISRNLDDSYSYITIDKGSVNGIKKNMPVIAFQNGNQGLVGKIVQVGAFTSQIIPIYNMDNMVSTRIQNTRDLGLVNGQGSQDLPLELQYIRKRVMEDLNIGDIVVTSGENDNYKRDIPIGTISKIEEIPYNSSLYIEITPIIDFSRLENLVVINQKELKDKMETK